MMDQSLEILFPEESRSDSIQKIESISKGEYLESVEIPILHKDGNIRVVLWNSANIYAEDGTTLLATIVQGIDITERKKTEEELAKHRDHLEELVLDRTKELEEKNKELKSYNRLFEGRELRIKELRDKVKEMEKKLSG